MYDEMAAANRKDMLRQMELRESRQQILMFLKDGPELDDFTRMTLELAADRLWEDQQKIVRRWD